MVFFFIRHRTGKEMFYMLLLFCLCRRCLIGELQKHFYCFISSVSEHTVALHLLSFPDQSNQSEVYVAHLSVHYVNFCLLCL